jgi:hypothetical protein
MKARTYACFATFAVALLMSVPSRASVTIHYSGQMCVSEGGGYNQWGQGNDENHNVYAYCPINWSPVNDFYISSATLLYYDASSASFDCYYTIANWDGSTYWGSSVYSCDTWGGCAQDTNPGYTRYGQLNFGASDFGIQLYPLSAIIKCAPEPGYSSITGYEVSMN